MMESTEPSASTGALLEPSNESSSPRPPKRRQSSEPPSNPSTKRARLSLNPDNSINSPDTIRGSTQASPDAIKIDPEAITSTQTPPPAEAQSQDLPNEQERRKSNALDERKRGQRLFGGLLNTLSQKVPNTTQKRRQEIEKRQLEKAKVQKAEDEKIREEKMGKLKEVRRKQQLRWDHQSMRIRHSNSRAMANFLCTKTEPKLYYKPWELLPADVERIKTRISDTNADIAREERDFRARHGADLQISPDPEKAKATEEEKKTGTVGEHRVESSSLSSAAVLPESTNGAALPISSEPKAVEPVPASADLDDENGELVVGDEDTILY